ncbi:MAG: beta-ketoacyl-ACP synthase [Verrucomicrobia bacterium]|nr:beta-ketoacyl-ACP synthase [Verrucomicrobiota bacterium]
MRRVVVTGMAGLSPIGHDWPTVERHLIDRQSGVVRRTDWEQYEQINTRLAAPISDFELPAHYPRKKTRSMGRVSQLAVRATELALEDAGLLDDPALSDGRTGIAYGSSTGSTEPIGRFNDLARHGSMKNINATSYIQMMSHTCAVNLGLFFEVKGRVVPTCSACTSGSQGIGLAYEAIKFGLQDVMIAGGAEELCITEVAVFDVLYATSVRNDKPDSTPRPFDKDRDGLVIGEGAGTLILESYDHAKARGATIHAEIVGFGYNADGDHVTTPSSAMMQRAMEIGLETATLPPAAIGYVNAHATATELGDIAESQATFRLFGNRMPISSLKSYMGHTLGASGALEAWLSIEMLKANWFAPTIHLDAVDERCGDLDYLREGRVMDLEYVMSNNFAFGGINTSLIFKRAS